MSDEHKSGTIENWASGGQLEIKILRDQVAALKTDVEKWKRKAEDRTEAAERMQDENAKLREALEKVLAKWRDDYAEVSCQMGMSSVTIDGDEDYIAAMKALEAKE